MKSIVILVKVDEMYNIFKSVKYFRRTVINVSSEKVKNK